LRLLGENVSDQKNVEKVLSSMPKKLKYMVASIEESKDLSMLLVDDLLGSLVSHDSWMNKYDVNTIENAFKSQVSVSKSRGRRRIRRRGKGDRSFDHGEHKEWFGTENRTQ